MNRIREGAGGRSPFGALLREFRVAARLSQEALAERATVSTEAISALERGVSKAPQRETLELIVDALHLEPQQRHAIEVAARKRSLPRRTKAPAARLHNLPHWSSPLFGRENDLAAVQALLAKTQVLTLTGAGGVGKTRLATEIGFHALDGVEDGVWFVDLAAVGNVGDFPAALAGALGVRENPRRPLIDTIVESLKRKNVLLILDNCEHVVGAASAAVEKIAAGCPDVRILATSRQPLEILGERTYRLGSLRIDASVELFFETAQRVDASFAINNDVPLVERICRRLDGIALAIELAAARTRLLSLAQIENLLAERFAVLAGGGRLPRHQTMRALVDWSYDLLAPDERLLLSRLGVFPADFSFEAVVAICAGDGLAESRVLDTLASLVDKSLLISERRDKTRRFRLLETMRAYALEKLGPSLHELHRCHAQYCLELVESGNPRAPEWHDALETDYDNLRHALEWTIDENGDVALGVRLLAGMREFLLHRGLVADSARRAERALDGRAPLTTSLQAMAWETIASMRGDLLLPTEALEATTRALALHEELEDLAGVARALRRRGVAYLRLGNFAQADADLQRALELSREYDDARGVARTLGSIAVGLEMRGHPREGQKALLEALAMARQEGDERLIAVTLINLAESEFALGDLESSVSRLEELLASRASQKNGRLRANTKANLAVYLLAVHREDEARAIAREAVFDAREAGDTGIAACAIQHLASLLSRSDPRTAAKLLGFVDGVFAAGYRREPTERYTLALLMRSLRQTFSDDEIAALGQEGSAMSEPQAVRLATRTPRTGVP